MKDKLFTRSYIAIMTANFMQMFGFWTTMPLLPFYLEENFGCSEARIGAVLSLFTVAALMFRPFSGYLLDTFRRKPLYLVAYFLFTLVFAGYIVCTSLMMFALLRVWHGVAFGTQSVGGNTLCVDIMPSSRRGEGLGYYGLVNNIALSVGPMTGLFMKKCFSYNGIFTMSLVVCIIGFIAATLIKPKKKTAATAPDVAKNAAAQAPATAEQTVTEHNAMPTASTATPATTAEVKKSPLIKLDRFILLRGIPASVSLLLLSIPYGATINFVAMYVRQMGLQLEPGWYFTLLAIGMGVSRLFSGKLVDRGYITRTISIGLYFIIAAFALLASCEYVAVGSKTVASVIFFTVPLLQGVGFGTLFPAYNSLYLSLAPHNRRATATSTYLTAWDAGIGTGLVASGIIAEHTTFGTVYLVGACLCVISTLYFNRIVTPHFVKHRIE